MLTYFVVAALWRKTIVLSRVFNTHAQSVYKNHDDYMVFEKKNAQKIFFMLDWSKFWFQRNAIDAPYFNACLYRSWRALLLLSASIAPTSCSCCPCSQGPSSIYFRAQKNISIHSVSKPFTSHLRYRVSESSQHPSSIYSRAPTAS